MTPEQLERFVDPDTGAPLKLHDPYVVDGHVRSGTLRTEDGGAEHAIEGFIPRFVPGDNYAENFGYQWQVHQKTQLDSYTGASYSRDRYLATTGWPLDMRGQRILEAGSGAGRFTEIMATTGAEVVSFDFSEAVVANHKNNGHHPNLTLFQGDIYRIPLQPASFDKVICLGVLQHTPDVERSFRQLAGMVRPGGELVVDVYPRRLRGMLHWKYALRPLATRFRPATLYRAVSWYAPKLIPLAKAARSVAGKAGHRLLPILDQSDKSVPAPVQREWTILDTFDALSAKFDSPQTPGTLNRWFETGGFSDIQIVNDEPRACALIGRGRRLPEGTPPAGHGPTA